ncbi:MAG: PD-(D/E)XK nuclease family protein [Cyanobacteria bacterium J06643_4]
MNHLPSNGHLSAITSIDNYNVLPLNQNHLTLLESCPRKYEHVVFNSLYAPASYEQHLKTQWGSQFHLLMQQQALDLPVDAIASANTDMQASLAALEKAAPDVFKYLPVSQAQPIDSSPDQERSQSPDANEFSQSEHKRTLAFNGYLLTVIYDLVVLEPGQTGHIFDWKTYQKPPKETQLANDWQTRLYQYVLCETTSLRPEQIAMTYWFVRVDEAQQQAPSFYRFNYSLAAHDKTRQDLQRLSDRLTEMRSHNHFPKVDIAKGLCDYCTFNARCDRIPSAALGKQPQDPNRLLKDALKAASQVNIDSIEEITL